MEQALPPPIRLSSIDAFRGFVMFLMMAEILHVSQVAKNFPESETWKQLAFNTSHVEWTGCSLHDLIQPSFTFLVGAALPFSLASRRAKNQSFRRMLLHACWRAFLLVALGVFLRSTHSGRTRFTFEDTLSQIGLGYLFVFLLGFCKVRWQVLALAVVLIGYWCAFRLYPAPAADFDYSAVGVSPEWIEKNPLFTGQAAHWNKNSNLAWTFDQSFLRHFPHEEPFKPNLGGYCTLSFIPTLGTMILGLLAGGWLKKGARKSKKILGLVAAGAISLAAGFLLDKYGICPSVKRIWTPAWTLYSGGWCFLILAGFYGIVDGLGWRRIFFPLIVIGMNSIAIYVLVHINLHGFILDSFRIHLGFVWDLIHDHLDPDRFAEFEKGWQIWRPLIAGGGALFVEWLLLFWMYCNKIFVRI